MASALLALQGVQGVQDGRQAATQEQRQRPASAVQRMQPTRRRGSTRHGGGQQQQNQQQLLLLQMQQQQQADQMQQRELSLQQEMGRQKWNEMERRRQIDEPQEQMMKQQLWEGQLPTPQGYPADVPANYGLGREQYQRPVGYQAVRNDEPISNDLRRNFKSEPSRNQYDVNWSSKPIVVWASVPDQRNQLPPIPLLDQLIYHKQQ